MSLCYVKIWKGNLVQEMHINGGVEDTKDSTPIICTLLFTISARQNRPYRPLRPRNHERERVAKYLELKKTSSNPEKGLSTRLFALSLICEVWFAVVYCNLNDYSACFKSCAACTSAADTPPAEKERSVMATSISSAVIS